MSEANWLHELVSLRLHIFNPMNYQKIITDLEHHAREAAEFLAGWTGDEEMESEKAAHRAMVCAIRALRKLTQERAAHLEAMQYTVSVDKILRPDERHTRLEELLALANVSSEPCPPPANQSLKNHE
jgi:truncated hemoglobin YjbI